MTLPVLGILTLYLNDRKHLEEKPVYQKMISEGKKIGLDVFVFTPADVDHNKKKIYALEYDPTESIWTRKWRSFPNMIYDRCRIQKSSRFKQLLQFRSRYRHLLFLNRPLRNKWTIHEVMSHKSEFRPFLPETRFYSSLSDVYAMLKNHTVIYVKPINGTGGRGILRIEKLKAPSQYVIQGRNQKREIITPRKLHASRLGSVLNSWKLNDSYIVQEGISIELPDGRVHDYRMLVQKNKEGIWQFTGMAGRIGAPRSVTSNLHGGGKAVPADTLLEKWITDPTKRKQVSLKAEKFGLETAAYLEKTYGALCELALDLAINKYGDIYLLEVNPKPAREVFSQSGEAETYRDAIVRPMEYALWLYQQQ
ncbi:YheC/YheD family endospore coat-associated protein [Paenibacillus pini]|uniref:ATP-grasp domain-containing protein n=1 Tax=Paenibacillus pini JCM 16418 TaxID=1236976 RepID=W7YNR7_9BACL|nr:YheC/YheD family protein [Paenibacillus pini]GAF06306.1 hypothetical protein JCM16418_257 [Paenibacillus pini JCM 16418]